MSLSETKRKTVQRSHHHLTHGVWHCLLWEPALCHALKIFQMRELSSLQLQPPGHVLFTSGASNPHPLSQQQLHGRHRSSAYWKGAVILRSYDMLPAASFQTWRSRLSFQGKGMRFCWGVKSHCDSEMEEETYEGKQQAYGGNREPVVKQR